MGVIKWAGIVAVLLVLLLAGLAWFGAARWAGLTQQLFDRLDAGRRPPQPARFDARELEGLPPPVQRFFRAVIADGQPMVAAVQMQHRGSFNMGEQADDWKPFTSVQRAVTQRPGFVWDGRIAMAPGLAVHVHDAYVQGRGLLHPAIAGLVTLMELEGEGDIAVGEAMRFFAEAAWYPTALLPSQGVRWDPVDEHTARATLVDGKNALTLTFTFGDDGLVQAVRADARGRTVGGRVVPTPWEGRWSQYETRDGLRVPMAGEVAWLLPEGRKPYWRGNVTSLRYEFAR